MIDEKLIQTICSSFANGKSIRRNLPYNSKLVIDQKLPYICVYRFKDSPDTHLRALLQTQGAYLLASVELEITRLLESLTEVAQANFKSFMILEIWSDVYGKNNGSEFRILHPKGKIGPTTEALEKGFKEFTKLLPRISVSLEGTEYRHPPDLQPLIEFSELQKTGTLLIGIAIPTVFYDPESQKNYALFFRKIRRRFAEVIKIAAFEFTRVNGYDKFEHHLMLGKTRLDNLVRFADKRLAVISANMDFLLRITPINATSEWEKFKNNDYSKPPRFNYRLISLDPELEKRKLFSIRLERIEHPTLAFIFRDKRAELEKQLIMLEERGTKKFFHTSMSIYGNIDADVMNAAHTILDDKIPNEQIEHTNIYAEDFARIANTELDKYRMDFPTLRLNATVKESVSGLLVSGEELSVGKDLNISEHRVNALIQHEIGTHILTYCNGKMQPLQLMSAGFAGYEQLQEGMAVLAEFLVGGLNINRLKLLAARVIAVDALIHDADFIETYNMLTENYGFRGKTSFGIAMRVFRGGGYTKDAIYLKGLIQLLNFIKNGGDLKQLYGGKFALEHLPLVEELTHLRILKKPYLPDYLSTEEAATKIQRIKKGIQLKELVE